MQATAQQAASALVSEVAATVAAAPAEVVQDVAMDVDAQAHGSDTKGKRKAEDELVPEEPKKAHVGEFVPLIYAKLISLPSQKQVPRH